MRKLLPLILLMMSLSSFGQFKTIYPDRTVFYRYMSKDGGYRKLGLIGETGEFIPVKIESTKVVEEDTLYNNYHVFGFTGLDDQNCIVTSGGASWTGKKIIMSKDNREIFINKNNDSIIFKKYAKVGDSWTFFNNGDSSFIATVTKKETESISIYGNQVTDSVMTIVVSLKNHQDDTPLEHSFNGRDWKISKNYGFIKTYDLLNFPEDTVSLLLAGDDKKNIGVKNLTEKEVFNFEVGDEFHIKQEDISPGEPYDFIVISKIRQKIVEKIIDNIKDSIFYKIEVIENKFLNVKGVDSFAYIIDTLKLNIAMHPHFNGINEIAGKSFPFTLTGYTCQFFHEGTPSVMAKFVDLSGYIRTGPFTNSQDSCYRVPQTLVPIRQSRTNEFLEGFGGPYYEDESDPLMKKSRKLIYYKKADKEGGVPFEFVLDVFASTSNLSVSLSPNPASDRIKISSEGIQDTYYKIYNNEGKEVLYGSFSRTEETININSLRSGIYSMMILKEGGIIYTSRFVKN